VYREEPRVITKEQLARIVLDATKLREDSWNSELEVYGMSEEFAVIEATKAAGVDEEFWYPVYLAFHWRNDLLEWTEAVLEGRSIKDLF
jgi:hypothetical protein